MQTIKTKRVGTREKDRLNFRLDPEIKARVIRAAALTGQEVTDFAVSTLNEKAAEIIERFSSITLSSEEYSCFLNVLSDNRKPSKQSRAAARRYRRGGRKGSTYHLAD